MMRTDHRQAVAVCGAKISLDSPESILEEIGRSIGEGRRGQYISVTNTESIYHAARIPAHSRYVQNARLSVCDGIGVVVAGLFSGQRIRRFNGPVLQLECCQRGIEPGWRHFFYGGKEDVADLMVERLQVQFPGLVSVGTYAPPFRELTPEEDAQVIRLIREARPDIVWVGLGLLKQEAWIEKHLKAVDAPWMVGVGAAFDYHSGAVPWAPAWMRALGLEWLFRLVIQPRLRAKRYWWSLLMVVDAAGDAFKKRVWQQVFWRSRS